MVYAVLLAGGTGTRTGFKIPKQFIQINNKPLLSYCIDKFIQVSDFKKIIVSSPKQYLSETKKLIEDYYPEDKRLVVVEGGRTRQDTLLNSLDYIKKFDEDCCVVCHDAARIFVSVKQIKDCIKFTKKFGSSSPIIPSTDVIIEINDDVISNMPNRFNMVHVQTPQGFYLNEYTDFFSNLSPDEKETVHEIIRVYFLNNEKVYLFDGEQSNFKITTSVDVELARQIINKEW